MAGLRGYTALDQDSRFGHASPLPLRLRVACHGACIIKTQQLELQVNWLRGGWHRNKDRKLMKQMKFPPEFDKKVNPLKICWKDPWNVLAPDCHLQRWIQARVTGLLGMEDEVVQDMIFNMLKQVTKHAKPKFCRSLQP